MAKKRASRVAKTRNGGTMTESSFWSMIRSALRRKWMYWVPRRQVLEQARYAYTGPNKRRKWEYECSVCKGKFDGKEVEVDHVIAAGSLKGYDDVALFIQNLFVEDLSLLRVVCRPCHKEITKNQKNQTT